MFRLWLSFDVHFLITMMCNLVTLMQVDLPVYKFATLLVQTQQRTPTILLPQ